MALLIHTLWIGAIWGIISKAKSKGETAGMYEDSYGKDFKTRNIAILYTLYEQELEKLNLVVSV
jgi:DNA helicase-2/ATP-dependent DNA helicase PcrA